MLYKHWSSNFPYILAGAEAGSIQTGKEKDAPPPSWPDS